MRAFFRRLLQPAFGLSAVFVPEVVHQGFFGGQMVLGGGFAQPGQSGATLHGVGRIQVFEAKTVLGFGVAPHGLFLPVTDGIVIGRVERGFLRLRGQVGDGDVDGLHFFPAEKVRVVEVEGEGGGADEDKRRPAQQAAVVPAVTVCREFGREGSHFPCPWVARK